MKKTLTTNGGQAVTFFTKEHERTIYAFVEGANASKFNEIHASVGFCFRDEEHPFEIEDYNGEFEIHVWGNEFEEAFDAFCEAYIGILNIREVKRAEFIKRLERLLAEYKETSIVTCDGTTFEDLCRIVEKNADDADF